MSTYHGKGGNLTFASGAIANLLSWTLSTSAQTAEYGCMGDTWKTALPGIKDFSGSAEVLAGSCGAGTLGTEGDLVLSLGDSGPTFTGTAICTSLSETANYESEGKASIGFEANDTDGLTYAATGGTTASPSSNGYHGKSIKATFDSGDFASLREWSINLSCATGDSTAAHATNFGRTRAAGLKSGTASLTCLATGDFAVEAGADAATLQLYRTTSELAYSGDAICTGAELTHSAEGIAIVTYNFIFAGAMT